MLWLVIESGHPAFRGHFPGNPVLPGVVLLEYALELAREVLAADAVPAWIPVAKFLKPVRPGETLLIGLEVVSSAQLRFICRVGGESAVSGTFTLARPESG